MKQKGGGLAPSGGGPSHTHWFDWLLPSGAVEEVVDVQSCSLAYDGLQLSRGGVAQPLEAAEVPQQSQSLDVAHPRDLLHHPQDQGVQQLKRRPPPERVLPAVHVDLEAWETGRI